MRKYIIQNKLLFAGYLVVMILAQILGTGFAFVMSAFIDAASRNTSTVLLTLLFGILYVMVCVCLEALYSFLKNRLIRSARESLKSDLFQAILSKNYHDYNMQNTANYINELTNNISIYESTYFSTLLTIPTLITMFLTASIAIIELEPEMLLIMVVLALFTLATTRLSSKPLAKSSDEFVKANEEYLTEIKDDFTGYDVIHSFGILNLILHKHSQSNQHMENRKYHLTNLQTVCTYLGEFVGLLSTVIVMGVAAYFAAEGSLSVGLVIAFGHLSGQIISPITQVPSMYADYSASKPLTQRFEGLLSTPLENSKVQELSFHQRLCLDNLSFAYENRQVLDHMSLSIERNQKVAIVGKSGCGKTTLFHLLLGHYRNYTGHLFLDGTEIKEISEQTLSTIFGVVSQETFLFHDSLIHNLTVFQDKYSQEAIADAISRSGLSSFVKLLPEGVQSIISENGKNISGGERQRIGLARLLLSNQPVMLFDEPTANLDPKTTNDIMNHILSIPNRTVIVITHSSDEHLLSLFDQVITLQTP